MTNKNKNPQSLGTMGRGKNTKHTYYTQKKYLRQFDRSLLPTPASYYSREFPGLKIKSEWVKVLCCFHEETIPSLNISMIDGHFRCFSCGAKGCDVIAFQRLHYGLSFVETITRMGAWKYE